MENKNNNIIDNRSYNIYQKEFLTPSNQEEDNIKLTKTFIFHGDKLYDKILDNQLEDCETVYESKIKRLSGKNLNLNTRHKSLHYSGKNMNKEIQETLEEMGFLSSKNEESLILRKIPNVSEENFQILQNKFINENTFRDLYDCLDNVNCNFKNLKCDNSVGGITPLEHLIEKNYNMNPEYAQEMNNKYIAFKNYINSYREVNGDGNCFYRAVMFRYFELLILNNQINYLKNVICDVINSFNSPELKSRTNIRGMDIKPELTFQILLLILDLLKKNMKDKAHEILVKSFSTSVKFDYAIIFYFRYILYDYIRKNENKVYLKSFPIKIGNILPSQYENDGKFLFNSFYEN